MERQLRMGGGIMDVVPREPAILGGIKKAVKKVTKGVKKIAKSPIGKAAIAYGLTAGLGSLGAGASRAGSGSMFGFLNPTNVATNLGLTGSGNIGSALAGLTSGSATNATMDYSTPFRSFITEAGKKLTGKGITGTIGKTAALVGLSGFLTSKYGMTEEQVDEVTNDPDQLKMYLRRYYTNLNPNAGSEEIEEFVRVNSAEGGRIGFAEGPVLPPDPTQPVNPFGPKPGDFGIEEDIPIKMASNLENEKLLEALFEKYLDMGMSPIEAEKAAYAEFERMSKREEKFFNPQDRGLAALGGKMDTASDNAMQAAGIEGLPIRQNPKGVKELDLRETGGFIQPVGIKEKEDDIPAMLSNNEFVFTADAVRGMGDGNVNLGAQRMYDMMKKLEAGGRV